MLHSNFEFITYICSFLFKVKLYLLSTDLLSWFQRPPENLKSNELDSA